MAELACGSSGTSQPAETRADGRSQAKADRAVVRSAVARREDRLGRELPHITCSRLAAWPFTDLTGCRRSRLACDGEPVRARWTDDTGVRDRPRRGRWTRRGHGCLRPVR